MLGNAKNKTAREVGEALLRADTIERRVEDAEVALRETVENSRLLEKIEELEAQLERCAIAAKENSRLQGLIKELEAQLGATEKNAAEAAFKAVADFQASVECQDQNVEFATDTYNLKRQSVRDKVAARYLKLNLKFLDEVWDSTAVDEPATGVSTPNAAS